MSAELLISIMDKLYKLHRSLYEIAIRKTEIIKIGDIDSLNKVMKEENAHLAAIRKLEEERKKATVSICNGQENPTVTDCIAKLNGQNKDALLKVTEKLAEMIVDLKERNYLNQQLVHQSLQFVQVSLNLLRPKPVAINYGPPTKQKQMANSTHGIFNSQV